FFFLLLTLIALTIVVSLKIVGAILVFALLLIPPATAYQLTSSLRRMMLYAVSIGVLVSIAGVLLSFQFDLPTGPAIVLLATGVFFLAVAFSPKHRPKPALS
ncbi:MAG: metal ABC transporter permease, partial [Nitrospirota bacterium]